MVFPDELIGEEIEIVDSTNPSEINLAGKIVDETKMTLKISRNGGTKTVFKQNITIRIIKTGSIIRGEELTKRPEDRIKGK